MHSLERLPETSEYRKVTNNIIQSRLDIVSSTEDVAEIEAKVDDGQIEELIGQANQELSLIPQLEKWKVCCFYIDLGTSGTKARGWPMGVLYKEQHIVGLMNL